MHQFTTLIIALMFLCNVSAKEKPLKIFILVGQSNMQGTAHVKTLPYMANDPATKDLHDKIKDKRGQFLTYKNVQIAAFSETRSKELSKKHGPLTIGYGSDLTKEDVCGPELAFGITMYEELEEPILLIKAAWGGKSLFVDFRPPSAEAHSLGKDEEQKKAIKEATGHYYRLMIAHIKEVLADLGQYHPAYRKSAGYEIAGFAWFQGWNDMVDRKAYPKKGKGYSAYSTLLAHFIRDVRQELSAPEMPFAIGVMGVHGPTKDPKSQSFRDAMAAPASMPEFKSTVRAVLTENFWPKDIAEIEKKRKAKKELTDEEKNLLKIGRSNAAYHYLGNIKCYSQVGEALAKAILTVK